MRVDISALNPQQREVVLHQSGPLLVLAGAGSGKTNTMAYRIARLIADQQVAPKSILGLSFTNKAAAELKSRITLILKKSGQFDVKGLFIGTFHSLCVRILRQYANYLGYGLNFTILDESDQEDLVRQNSKSLILDEKALPARVQLYYFGLAKNQFFNSEQAAVFFETIKGLTDGASDHLKLSFEKYQKGLCALNAMDFDDLIYNTARLLKEQPENCSGLLSRFEHIIVDEYQDTNSAQFEIVSLLNQVHRNLVVVGDDDQAIYAWRGANSEHILGFSQVYSDAKIITLEQNYRSTNTILKASNAVIRKNSGRHLKQLWSDRAHDENIRKVVLAEDLLEAQFVAHEIQALKQAHNWPWKSFAVLYRSNTQSRVFEQIFRSDGIPYKIIGGMSFLDRKEVKDVLAYFRILSNRKDDPALRRIINWPARGIGLSTLQQLTQICISQNQPMIDVLESVLQKESFPSAAKKAIADFWIKLSQARMELLRLNHADQAAAWVESVLERFEIKKGIEADSKDGVIAEKRWDNVRALVQSLLMKKSSLTVFQPEKWLSQYCSQMALRQDLSDEKEDKDQATLLTLHGAKGLEFDVVFLVGLEDGLLPHKRVMEDIAGDLSEERRLFYVGITRAKNKLYLCLCKNRVRYGKKIPRIESRFLKDIPPELLDVSDETALVESPEQLQDCFEEFKKRLFGQEKEL